MGIGDKIREARLSKGMTQDELGRAIGSSKALINKYEKGVITNLPLDRVEQLSHALGVSISYLTGWPEPKKQTSTELLQELRDDVRGLLDVQKDMTPEQVRSMMDYAKFLKGQSNND